MMIIIDKNITIITIMMVDHRQRFQWIRLQNHLGLQERSSNHDSSDRTDNAREGRLDQ
jgi:hypothetical protein